MSGGGGGGEKEKKRQMIILKSEPKPDDRRKKKMMMKNMVQIHDEQRSIQMTISHRDTHINTAQTSTVAINNGSKNSKCRPKSDTE